MPTMLKKGLMGTKLGMTRVFQENGDALACTVVQAGPCTVIQKKTKSTDGYEAIQLRLAEQYIAQFGQIAKSSTTLKIILARSRMMSS